MLAIKMFSFGYYGWGNHTKELLRGIDAVEESRGYEAPFFVDIRIQRSGRAPGFVGPAFENLLGPSRHLWMDSLGNRRIIDGTVHNCALKDPSAIHDLLDLAVEKRKAKQRVIFFCGCPSPRECHREIVGRRLIRLAHARGTNLSVEEWPGGEPKRYQIEVREPLFNALIRGRKMLPMPRNLDLTIWSGVPWGSILKITSGDWYIRRLIGRVIKTTKHWAIPILNPDAATDLSVQELMVESERLRKKSGWNVKTIS